MKLRIAHTVVFFAVLLWASPWSMVGAMLGLVGLLAGGTVQRRGRVVEFHGPLIAWLLGRLPAEPMAMTLGHVVLGRGAAALDIARRHELVHVRQYERWGPLFVPAYLLCALWLRTRGKDAYRDNPFEREAYAEE